MRTTTTTTTTTTTMKCKFCRRNGHMEQSCPSRLLFHLFSVVEGETNKDVMCHKITQNFQMDEFTPLLKALYNERQITEFNDFSQMTVFEKVKKMVELLNLMMEEENKHEHREEEEQITKHDSMRVVFNDNIQAIAPLHTVQFILNKNINLITTYTCHTILNEQMCAVCYEDFDNIPKNNVVKTNCGHEFCFDCVKKFTETNDECPMCRKTMRTLTIHISCLIE